MDVQHKIMPFEVKAASGDGSTGTGYASAFHVIDSYGEIVTPRAFDGALEDFLANGFIGGLNHLWDQPIGRPTEAKTDARGLLISWKLSDTAHAMDVRSLLRDKVIRKLSIGYRTAGAEKLDTPDEVMDYWRMNGYTPSAEDLSRAQNGAVLLTKIKPLFEASPVTVPANAEAVITSVKGGIQTRDVRSFEHWLERECGMSHAGAVRLIGQAKSLRRGIPPSTSRDLEQIEVHNRAAILASARRNLDDINLRISRWGLHGASLSDSQRSTMEGLNHMRMMLEVKELNRKTLDATATFARQGSSRELATEIRSRAGIEELNRLTEAAIDQYRRR